MIKHTHETNDRTQKYMIIVARELDKNSLFKHVSKYIYKKSVKYLKN